MKRNFLWQDQDIKKAATESVTACNSLWTSLGLNQGPPDYESVALYGIEKLRFPMQPTELQALCTSLLTG